MVGLSAREFRWLDVEVFLCVDIHQSNTIVLFCGFLFY